MRLANGVGSVVKLSGKRHKKWWARGPEEIGPDGKMRRKSLGTYERKADAMQALSNYEAESNPTNDTLLRMYERYKEDRIAKEALEESTLKGYEDSFLHLRPLQDRKFTEIKLSDYEKLFMNMKKLNSKGEEPLSETTKKKVKSVLANIYKYAIRNEYVKINYGEMIELRKDENKKEKEVFSELQIKQMFNQINEIEDLDIVLIFIYTGLRPGELLKITKDNVDLERKVLFDFGIKTTKGKKRIMPISEKIFHLIEKRYNDTDKYLFRNSEGNRLTPAVYRRSRFNPAMKQLGFDHMYISPNSTRHTFATLMNQRNIRGPVQADLMGHEKYTTTIQNYNHENINELREAVNSL